MASLGAPMPAGITTPQDLAVALRYGPQTEQALRRSSYLTDALRQLTTEGSQNIHSGGELAAKLLAAAILNRKAGSSQDAVMSAMRADQGAETATSMAGLRLPPTGEAPTGAAPSLTAPPETPPPIPTPQPPPEAAPGPQQPPPQPGPAQGAYSPADRDALTRMLATEAIGEGPQGMVAAGHVALNRLKAGYGGAKSLVDVVNAPHQFTGMARANQVSPQDYAAAQQVADGVLSGQVPDPTNGAQAFLNPELTQKLYGRIPAWAQGNDGHRIGHHVFFGGQGAPQQIAQNGAQPPPPPPPPAPGQDVPVETAAAGADPFPASAPGISSPPAAGVAPAGVSPQAPPAGALPPNWPRWKPSPDKLTYVESLLNDPRHHAEGVALADQYRQKMLEPVEAQITMINGAPFYIPKDPTEGIPSMAVPIPQGAMTHIASAESLHLPAPHGTTLQVDPLGNAKPLTAPPPGYEAEAGPNGQYREHFVPGSAADPTRPQTPPPGYQYQGPATMAPIHGGPSDPQTAMNIASAAEKVQAAIRPTIDLARDARTSLGQVQAGFQLQNGAGDVAMLKGLNQLIAHGVVRPADVDQQLKADGIAGSLGELTGFLTSTGKLSPETRAKVAAASQALYASANQQLKSQVMSHRATTDAIYGDGAFDKYVLPAQQAQDLGWADAPPAPGGPAPPPPPQPHLTPGSREAAIAEARKRGLAVK